MARVYIIGDVNEDLSFSPLGISVTVLEWEIRSDLLVRAFFPWVHGTHSCSAAVSVERFLKTT